MGATYGEELRAAGPGKSVSGNRFGAVRSACWFHLIEFKEISRGDPIMSRAIDPRNIEVIDNDLAEVLRKKTPAERIAMVAAANRTARRLAAAGVRHEHPDWSEAQVHAEVLRRVCGGTD